MVKSKDVVAESVNTSSFFLASLFLRHASKEAVEREVGDTEYPTWVDGRSYIVEDCLEGITHVVSSLATYSSKADIESAVTSELYKALPESRAEGSSASSSPTASPSSFSLTNISSQITDVQVVLGLYRDSALKPSDAKLFHLVAPSNRLYIPKAAYGNGPGGPFKMPEEVRMRRMDLLSGLVTILTPTHPCPPLLSPLPPLTVRKELHEEHG